MQYTCLALLSDIFLFHFFSDSFFNSQVILSIYPVYSLSAHHVACAPALSSSLIIVHPLSQCICVSQCISPPVSLPSEKLP